MSGRPQFDVTPALYSSLEEFCSRFYDLLASTERVFRRSDGTITYVASDTGPRRVLATADFIAMAADILDLRLPIKDDRRGSVPALITRDVLPLLLGSAERSRLPRLEYVIHEPALVGDPGRVQAISTPGYHEPHATYYFRRPGDPRIEPRDSTEHLERLLSGVPFRNQAHKNNVIAWLVSGLSLSKRVNPPMLAITGSGRGVGKSSLMFACGYILTGQHQNSIQPNGGEFAKQLGAKFAAEQRFIALDNVTTQGQSGFTQSNLARLLTEGKSKSVRILGQSRSITQSGVLFALTANDCTLDQDLATRSLIVDLQKPEPGPMIPYVLHYAEEHRSEIFGELLGLALRSKSLAIPESYQFFRFVDWLRFTYPIVFPEFGDLAVLDAEELDERVRDLAAYGADNPDRRFSVSDFFDELSSNPDSMPGLMADLRSTRSRRGQFTKLGAFLRQMVGKELHVTGTLRVRLLDDGQDPGSKARYYKFEVIS